jgi:hypothetical protein
MGDGVIPRHHACGQFLSKELAILGVEMNQGLDRAVIVGIQTDRSGRIMAALLEQVYFFD